MTETTKQQIMDSGATQSFPRVSVLSTNPFSRSSSTGLVLHSLFSRWPSNRLYQIFFPGTVHRDPDYTTCTNFSAIDKRGVSTRLTADFLRSSGTGLETTVPSRVNAVSPMLWLRRSRVLTELALTFQQLWYARSKFKDALVRELQHCQPDVVFAVLGNFYLTKLVCQACSKLDLPLFVYVTDDYVESLYSSHPQKLFLKKACKYWFKEAVLLADGLAGISPIMAEEFSKKYGRKWDWFATLVNSSLYDISRPFTGRSLKLVYAGELGLDRWKCLQSIGTALKLVREGSGVEASLSIYSSPDQLGAYGDALNIPGVQLKGWIPYAELPGVFQTADLLVHAESFSPSIETYTRLSFSTKLSQYMMAQKCILFVGPETCGSGRMLNQIGSSISVEFDDPEKIATSLHSALRDPTTIQSRACIGRKWAKDWLDEETGSERFNTFLKARKELYK